MTEVSQTKTHYIIDCIEYRRVTDIISQYMSKGMAFAYAYYVADGVQEAVQMAENGVIEFDDSSWVLEDYLGPGKENRKRIAGWGHRGMQRAADSGTVVHEARIEWETTKAFDAEQFVDQCNEDMPEVYARHSDAVPKITQLIPWLDKHCESLGETEVIVWSDIHGYAGSVDNIGMKLVGIDRPLIADFKTGKSIRDSYAVQLGAYALAMKEQGYSIEDYDFVNILVNDDGVRVYRWDPLDIRRGCDRFLYYLSDQEIAEQMSKPKLVKLG